METILKNLLKLITPATSVKFEENKFKKPNGYKNVNTSQIQRQTK